MTMAATPHAASLETQLDQWRNYLRRRQAIQPVDIAELEDHLREQVAMLEDKGLTPDEAFLVAVKRMGNLDALSREFAREHSGRLWKQLVVAPSETDATRRGPRLEAVVALSLAIVAALLFKLPALFGLDVERDWMFYARNIAFFVLPLLAGFFAWKRGLGVGMRLGLGVAFLVAAVFANLYPAGVPGHTLRLSVFHLPIALWFVIGLAYAGKRWREVAGRMDFIRFSGELFIYYALIALGGGVLMGLMGATFAAIGIKVDHFYGHWLVPCGALGAIIVASWLVEAKQSVIENMAPVLTTLFTPLFTAVLLAFLGAVIWTGRGLDIDRNMLVAFDLLLAVVLGLLVYSISARDPRLPAGPFDVLQVVLVGSALLVDAVALGAIATRINEFGFTPNRVAALGENVILLGNLAWSAVLYVRFLRGRASFADLERWQTDYIPVYAAWAVIVVAVFPPLFGYA
jgi:hypothetical protein